MRQLAGEQPHAGVRQRLALDQAAHVQLLDEPVRVGGPEEHVDLGQRRLQLGAVSLHHAAYGHQQAAVAALLQARDPNKCIGRFLLRSVDEAARVDDYNVSIFRRARGLGAVGHELRNVPLAVDGVLVAAEGEKGEARQPRNDSSVRFREAWRSLDSAFSLIWRTRSRVMPSTAPISSSVIGS